MKTFLLFFLFPVFVGAQTGAQEVVSPKPGITIDGSLCLIGNTIYSCTPKLCTAVTINAGDSIEFCTANQIDLQSDSLYWMQWNFSGSSNYPSPVFDSFPTVTPVCYYAKWDTPGNYTADIFYNGWLSAHTYSDCYAFGPSHWIIEVTVQSSPNAVAEIRNAFSMEIFPNPGTGVFNLQLVKPELVREIFVTDLLGNKVLSVEKSVGAIDLSAAAPGVYFVNVRTADSITVKKLVRE